MRKVNLILNKHAIMDSNKIRGVNLVMYSLRQVGYRFMISLTLKADPEDWFYGYNYLGRW